MDGVGARLTSSLSALTVTLRAVAPDVMDAMGPGPGDREIDALEAGLATGVLFPDELHPFYRWFGGSGGWGRSVLPPFEPLSPSSVLEWYGIWSDSGLGLPPQWVPIASCNGDVALVAVCAVEATRECPLALVDLECDTFELPWASCAVFLDSVRDCYAEGVYRRTDDGVWNSSDSGQRSVWRRHHRPVTIDGVELPWSMAPCDTDRWPSSWRTAAGIRAEDEVLRGADATIRRWTASPGGATVVARVVRLVGTAGGSILTVDDDTARTTVAVLSSAVGARYLRCGDTFEFDLDPGRCPGLLRDLDDALDVSAVVTAMRRLT